MRWVIMGAFLAGCGGDKADGGGGAAGDGAEIELDRSPINFGSLEGETSRTEILAIRNAGSADLAVTVALTGSPWFTITGAIPASIPPMTTEELAITFQPAADGEADARLVLQTNDRDTPELEIPLSGEARFPDLNVEPGDPSFGSVYVGCLAQQSVYVENRGSLELTVESLAIPDGGAFSLDIPDHDPLPWTITPGDVRYATLVFAPLAAGEQAATLVVTSDDPLSLTTDVPLMGEGLPGGAVVDVWELPDKPRMVVLFAVNTGFTMQEHLTDIQISIVTMAEALDAAGIDYRIAAVVEDSGVVCGGVPYIDSSNVASAPVISWDMLGLGDASCGPGDNEERAFELLAAGLAANASWITDEPGWYESTLHLVGVSNEVEQSPGSWVEYRADFRDLREDPDDVVFHAIGGDYPSGCEGYEPYTGMYEAVVATGGVFLSICASSWSALGQELADTVAASDELFWLSEQPVVETLAVAVDGVAQPADRWSYDYGDNAIAFEPGYQPAGGATVEISYSIEGKCD